MADRRALGLCAVMVMGLSQAGAAPSARPALRCPARTERALWVSPRDARVGEPLRVLALMERDEPPARLALRGPSGWQVLPTERGGGPPFWWSAELPPQRATTWLELALLGEDDQPLVCSVRRIVARRDRAVAGSDGGASGSAAAGSPWPWMVAWDWSTEALYSAWVERLFAAPADERPSWSPLHQVLRDARRNWLYNHLGLDEDGPDPTRAVVVEPDCADLPYFLRAYFAWKLGLPFGWRHCDRGSAARPARCGPLRELPPGQLAGGASAAQAFSRLLRTQVSLVHSGAGRTAGDDDATDLYPVALTRAALRPGTVYVDPYGHLLVIARWQAQGPGSSGVLYAVDGHPDLSVGRKRFWRGAFLFVPGAEGGSGGFKAFRPLRVRGGVRAALTNAELQRERGFAPPSLEQYTLASDAFYARMDALINPRPLAPADALRERLRALHELMLERVEAVAAGEQYLRAQGGREIAMPEGPRIFETRGPWEDFSTPARDLRLLLAIDETLGFPTYAARHPERFAWPAGRARALVVAELERLLTQGMAAAELSYQRSDGAQQRLSVAEVIARRQALELAYNPNDCVERRWGAHGAELASCRRHAPDEQRARMEQYRAWFARRERPPLR